MKKIYVTQASLPEFAKYNELLQEIWENKQISNNGPMVKRLEKEIAEFLGLDHCILMANGTLALQIAIKALELSGEVITTPFSYVATTSSLLWEGCTPIFADIDEASFTINPKKIEELITDKTSGILATHVFGNACYIKQLQIISKKHGIPLLFDGAHGFGTMWKGKSLLSYGDVSICSLHATKLFNSAEGGLVIAKDPQIRTKIEQMRRFGHDGPNAFHCMGINAKMSELHAALGLCNLSSVKDNIQKRKKICELYDQLLIRIRPQLKKPILQEGLEWNYSYYPVIFPTESVMLKVKSKLEKNEIFPRRYFYPSINKATEIFREFKKPSLEDQKCPISEHVASRILAFPLWPEMPDDSVRKIASLTIKELDSL